MPTLAASFSEAARAAVRIDRAKVYAGAGLRAALGVAITLVVGRATGHTVAGVVATIGALSGGFASLQGTYRSRAAVIMAATAAMALAAFLGSTTGYLVGGFAIVAAAVSFAAGLLVALGPSAMVVGIQAVVGLVVFSQFHFPAAVAARDAGLVLAGGAVQAVLVMVSWPLRRFPAERRALGSAFALLAEFCRSVPGEELPLLPADAMASLEPLVRDAQPFGGDEGLARQVMAGQADRIRLELVALARARQRAGDEEIRSELDRLLRAAGEALDEVAAAVRSNTVPSGFVAARDEFEAALARLRDGSSPGQAGERDEAGWRGGSDVGDAVDRAEALAGQIRSAMRAAAALAGGDTAAIENLALALEAPAVPAGRRFAVWLKERLSTLRANLALSSQAFRHALRLGVAVGVADLVSRAFPLAHHYWLPMTTMLVLRPDFGSTVTRGLSRIFGTLIGAGVVTLILAGLRPSPDALAAIVVVLVFPAISLVLANYALFSVLIASIVVAMLAFIGEPDASTAGDRAFYTAVGALVALAAYLLWPTWEGARLPDVLAGLVEVEGRYSCRVLRAWAEPEGADRALLQQARLDARLARTNAEAAVTRWLSEPEAAPHGLGRQAVLGLMTAVRTCVQATLALHAELPEKGPGVPGAEALGADVERATEAVACRLRDPLSPLGAPPLRREQLELASRPGVPPAFAGETDLLVNAVNTLVHLVGAEGEKRTEGRSLEGDRGDSNPRPPGPQPGALTD